MEWRKIKKLRKPQAESLEIIDQYLKSRVNKSCLIHMPTGSGKSGVIAITSLLQSNKCVLIVTPRIALTEQIEGEICGKFNETLKKISKDDSININPNKKLIIRIDEKFSIDESIDYNNVILISTIQKIDWLRKNANKGNQTQLYNELVRIVQLVIFDEGHYEPAYSWSLTIRGFKTKKILFTATPFRNDLKPFDISNDYIYPYKYVDGVNDGYLRKVKFIPFSKNKNDSIFITNILNTYEDIFGLPNSINNPKIIIRCSHRNTIRRLAKYLQEKHPEYPYIGIHDKFKSDDDIALNLTDQVPENVKGMSEIIWLHQYKLTEGIDDNQFMMLAIYDTFNNERSLVQQIGRIIRRSGEEDKMAYVIEFTNGVHEKMWEKFKLFDKKLDKTSFRPISDKVLQEFYKIGNDFEYLLDGFKSKFDFNNESLPSEILLPRQANVIRKKKFSIRKFHNFLKERYEKNDQPFFCKTQLIDDYNVHIYISVNLGYFPHFPEEYSLNLTNDIILFFEYGDSLIYYDSSGYVPLNEKKAGLGKAKSIESLRKIYYEDPDNNVLINSVSLQNSNLGTNSIISHQYSARSIDKTVSFLDDNAQIVSTVNGKEKIIEQVEIEEKERVVVKNVAKIVSKYVGFRKGRVSQRGEWCNPSEYVQWIVELMELTNSKNISPLKTFNRYSKIANNVRHTNPKHILLDITEIENDFLFVNDNEKNITPSLIVNYFDELCNDIQPKKINAKKDTKSSFSFNISINAKEYNVGISYSAKSGTYNLQSDELDKLFEPKQNSFYQSVTEFLNKQQSFKIIPARKNVIYAYGQFYEVFNKYGKEFSRENYFLDPILIDIPCLDTIITEKGKVREKNSNEPPKENWDENSIFRLLADLGVGTDLEKHIGNPDIMVVDDPNKEIADFILGYKSKNGQLAKVVFIHAKCSGKHSYSASALQDVCGQATKNIRYLNMFNNVEPPNFNSKDNTSDKSWDKPWKWGNMTVVPRIRYPKNSNSDKVWKEIKNIIQTPTSEKEVWLLLGQTLKKSEFLKHLGKGTNEAIQADLLLHSTLQNVGTVNAKLKVFCSP